MTQYQSRNKLWFKVARHDAWIKQGKRCAYCFGELREDEVTGDHVKAQYHGGTIDGNIAAACADCNKTKGSLSKDKFKKVVKGTDTMDGLPQRRADGILLCRSRRRINLAADRACKRILASVGIV